MFERMLDAMHLGEDDDYDEDEEYEAVENASPFFKKFSSDKDSVEEKKTSKQPVEREKPVAKASPKITPMRNKGKGNNMEVCVIKPTLFEDSREISETLLANRTVILNMEGLDLGIAQRIIDFTCGTCYAIDGNLQKISPYMFVITPAGVELSGDLLGMVDAFDFSGIQAGF